MGSLRHPALGARHSDTYNLDVQPGDLPAASLSFTFVDLRGSYKLTPAGRTRAQRGQPGRQPRVPGAPLPGRTVFTELRASCGMAMSRRITAAGRLALGLLGRVFALAAPALSMPSIARPRRRSARRRWASAPPSRPRASCGVVALDEQQRLTLLRTSADQGKTQAPPPRAGTAARMRSPPTAGNQAKIAFVPQGRW